MGNRCVWTYTLLTVAVSLIHSWKLSSVKLQNASQKSNLLIVLVSSFAFSFFFFLAIMAEIGLFIIEHYRQSMLKLLLLLFTVGFSPVICGSLVIL